MENVRVRFAPSPTGPLHIGGVRTALYNYLFAKKNGGDFILRVEDTDQKRYVEGAEDYIMDSLEWLGLSPDESPRNAGGHGPYRQSERKNIYKKYVDQLLDSGHAYYAFDSAEDLEQMRSDLEKEGVHSPKYDASTRDRMKNSLTLSEAEVQRLLQESGDIVVRLKIEPGEEVTFQDVIRGDVTFKTEELDDKVILKADGLPTYHWANIVDDHLMEISHVIRGEEWLSSTAHHVLMYRFMGWDAPVFAHLPLILKPTGKGKLSKRDGAKFGFPVFPMEWKAEDGTYAGFKEAGYLPEALINFLAFLGWNPGTEQELFSLDELTQAFSLEKIHKSGARFDIDKARWYNQQYIIAEADNKLAEAIQPLIEKQGYTVDKNYLTSFVRLMKERVTTLPEFLTAGAFFFETPNELDEKNARKKYDPENRIHFEGIINELTQISDFNSESAQQATKGYIQEKSLSMGKIMPILRIALCGTMKGPDLFETMELLGREETLLRLSSGIARIENIYTGVEG